MLNFRKIKLLVSVVLMAGVVFPGAAFSQDKRSPFKNCLPQLTEQPKEEAIAKEVTREEEESFDVSRYTINGLIWGTQEAKAIINNEIYSVGDKLGEAKITKIGKNGVTVIFNNKEYTINIEKSMKTGTKKRRARNEY